MIRINLLQPDKRELKPTPEAAAPKKKKRKAEKKATTMRAPSPSLILLLFVAVIAVLVFMQMNAIKKENSLKEQAESEKASLRNVEQKLNQVRTQKGILEQKKHLIKTLESRQTAAVDILDELSKEIPEWVWLTGLSYNQGVIVINGRATSYEMIAEYISRLEKNSYFANVNLVSSQERIQRNDRYLEFTLTTVYISPYPVPPPLAPPEKKPVRRRR
ncbi:MAG: PilN domain-containing protein [Candidatus Aminicenantes bacterium]|nr:PilN domain-containing protein [Candidatus Aminicenantes bacterium]